MRYSIILMLAAISVTAGCWPFSKKKAIEPTEETVIIEEGEQEIANDEDVK